MRGRDLAGSSVVDRDRIGAWLECCYFSLEGLDASPSRSSGAILPLLVNSSRSRGVRPRRP